MEWRRPKLTGRAVVLAVVAAVLVVSYASSLRAWLQQRSEITLLQTQISDRRAAVASMQAEVRRWQDPAYVETQARERFGWVLPGEIGYRVLGLNGQPLSEGNALTAPTHPAEIAKPDWWSAVWGSVEAAGRRSEAGAGAGHGRKPVTRIGPPRGGKQPVTRDAEAPPSIARHLPAEQW